jgi:SAM-dependent methyltransferase
MQMRFAPLIERMHRRTVHGGRANVLALHLAEMLPRADRILDVGCGDGLVDRCILERRPDIYLEGIDAFPREKAQIAVRAFDGIKIPDADRSFDTVMFIDVLHHAKDLALLLREGVRVTRKSVLIKDHYADGFGARAILRLMDLVGNASHEFAWSGKYKSREQWKEIFQELNLSVVDHRAQLRLYPRPADWIFGRSYHFIARLEVQ